MRRLAIVALLLWVRPLHAADDDPELDRPSVPYWMHGRLDGPTAKLEMRFRLDVREGYSNNFELDLPDYAVATAATITIGKQQRELSLVATEKANAAFEVAQTAAAGPHRQWVVEVMPSLSYSGVAVQVAAPQNTTMMITVSVDAPACFHRDARYIAVPTSWRGSIDTSLKMIGERETDPCTQQPRNVEEAGQRLWIEMPTAEVSRMPFGEQRIATVAKRVDVQHGHFARVELALASQISHVPPDLHTVFLIDASRSVTGRQLETQGQLILSYLKHAPQTQVQIVAYSRKARALLPGFEMASLALPRIERELAALQTANGSNVDVGLAEAAAWLAHVDGTRRVVLFSDQHLPDRVAGIAMPALSASLPAHTLVHVVALDEGTATSSELQRDDEIAFAHVAIDSEGASLRARADNDGKIDALQLVRPIALEGLQIKTATWNPFSPESSATSCPGNATDSIDLAEGAGCTWWGDGIATAGPIVVEGLLWNHHVSRTLAPVAAPTELARMLTGFHASLGGEAEKEIEQLAHAVNEEWSLFAAWGGGDGYADVEGFGRAGYGFSCSGVNSDSGFGSRDGGHAVHTSGIADQITRAAETCHPTGAVTINLETTLEEIVNVGVTAPNPSERSCITEAMWDLPLAITNARPHDEMTIVL